MQLSLPLRDSHLHSLTSPAIGHNITTSDRFFVSPIWVDAPIWQLVLAPAIGGDECLECW